MTSKTRTPRNIEQLRAAYFVAFDNFATDRSEVAAAVTAGDKPKATRLLNKLRSVGLIDALDVNDEAQGDSKRGAFRELTWQANQTHDSIDRDEAGRVFDRAFGIDGETPAEPVAAEPKPATPSKPRKSKSRKSKSYSAELTRVARQTGATVRLIDNRDGKFEVGDPAARWVTLCETHGNFVTHSGDRKLARSFLAVPAEFCADCAKLVDAGERVPASEGTSA